MSARLCSSLYLLQALFMIQWATVLYRVVPSFAHISKRSDCHTVKLSDCQTVRLSNCQTVKQSYCQTVRLSDCQTIKLSNSHTVRLSDCHPYVVPPPAEYAGQKVLSGARYQAVVVPPALFLLPPAPICINNLQ